MAEALRLTCHELVTARACRPQRECWVKRNRGGDDKKNEAKTPKVDEKAYKAALQPIPEPKERVDPWGIARPANPAKTSK